MSVTDRLESYLPRRGPSLGEGVVAYLVDAIVGGTFPVASSLPSEPDLCSTLGVSRSVVRESVKVLQDKGLVKVRRGNGTDVADADNWNLLDSLVLSAMVRHDSAFTIIDEMVTVRASLEAQMAHDAALRSTPEEVQVVRDVWEEMSRAQEDPGRYFQYDLPFHDAIMRASKNRLGRNVVRAMQREASVSPFYTTQPSVPQCRRAHLGHTQILEHLAAGNAELAASVMHEHITSGWRSRKMTAASAESSETANVD